MGRKEWQCIEGGVSGGFNCQVALILGVPSGHVGVEIFGPLSSLQRGVKCVPISSFSTYWGAFHVALGL